MIYKESTYNRLAGQKHYQDWRTRLMEVADIVSMRKMKGGRFPMRRVTLQVRNNENWKLKDVSRWYPRALVILEEIRKENGLITNKSIWD